MFNGFHTMGAAGWVWMTVFWVVLLGLIVWAIVHVLPRRDGPAEGQGRTAENSHEILDRRLAAGEIDVRTYDQLRSKLDPHPRAGRG